MRAYPGRAAQTRDRSLGDHDPLTPSPCADRASATAGRSDVARVLARTGRRHRLLRLLYGRDRLAQDGLRAVLLAPGVPTHPLLRGHLRTQRCLGHATGPEP